MSVKANRVINILTLISAAFTFTCYVFYILGGTVLSDSGGVFVTATALLITTLPIIFAKFIKKYTHKLYYPLKIIYCSCLCIYMICFIVFSSVISFHKNQSPVYDSRQTVIIVCGSKVNGYTPGNILLTRLDAAYEILTDRPDSVCILSGGQGEDETVSESECMASYLIDKGIPATRLIKEDRSRNTEQNIEFSIDVMKKNNISTDSNIICISSDYHILRVSLIAEQNGLDVQCVAAKTPSAIKYISGLVRELMSYVKYFVFK